MMPLDLPRRGHVRPSGLWCPEAPDVVPAHCAAGYVPGPVQRRRVLSSGGAPTPPSGAALLLYGDHPAQMRQNSSGTTTVASGDPVGWLQEESSATRLYTQATSAARPTYASSAWGGLGALRFTRASSQLLIPQVAVPPGSGVVTYAFSWQLATLPTSALYGLLGQNNGSSAGTITLISGLTATSYPPLCWRAAITGGGATMVGLNFTHDLLAHTLVWSYLGGTATAAASYRAVLDGVDVTASIVTGSGTVDNGSVTNALGAYTTGGSHAMDGWMHRVGRVDVAQTVSEMQSFAAWVAA